ncbi:MAG: hypothetical protein AB7Q23_02250 [Hyphomonadaceae bacterium]
MRLLTIAALMLATLVAAPAFAQPIPDALRSAGVTQAQWDAIRAEARVQAERARISEAALLAAAEAASANFAASGRFNARRLERTIFDALADQADQIAELQHRLAALTGDADPGIAAIFTQARVALGAGRLADADRLLAQVAQRDLAAIQAADAEAERRRLRAGETIASRALVAVLQADYLAGADLYARAGETAPQSAIDARWDYTTRRGRALYDRGRLFVEQDSLRRSIAAYEAGLALRPRAAGPLDWASLQADLGNAFAMQGEYGAPGAMERAVAAYEAALGVITRESDPGGWALIQMNLGNVLSVQGERGAPGRLARAAAAYEAALTVLTREASPVGWALIQLNLGGLMLMEDERGVDGALERAVAAFEGALGVLTREANATNWARTQNNLGIALLRLGRAGAPGAIERAIVAFDAALTVMTRASDPSSWASAQLNLGNAHRMRGELGAAGAFERSVAAYQDALTVMTREANPVTWADAVYGLATTYRAMGRYAEARAAMQGALEVYEQIGNALWAGRARAFLAQLPGG